MSVHFSVRDTVPEAIYTADTVTVTTDIPSHLWMRWTHVQPLIHTKPRLRRGMWLNDDVRFCFVVYQDLEQDEPGDTTQHTFTFEPCTDCFQFWYYLWGYIDGIISPSTSVIFKYPDQGDCPPPPYGTIIGEIDQLEFDPVSSLSPKLLRISLTTYAIVYQGYGNDGWLRTIQVLPDGTIAGEIDSLEFDPVFGQGPEIVHVDGNVYAIAYNSPGAFGRVITLTISGTGTIGPIISGYIYEPVKEYGGPAFRHISSTTYGLWYSGEGNDGWLTTIKITNGGIIGPVLDWKEFDPVFGFDFSPHHISSNVWACAYKAGSYGGTAILLTLAIDPTGSIGPIIDTEVFDLAGCNRPDLFHISGNVYAIAYQGPDRDGWLKTITINPGGTISPVIAELEFDPTLGDYCSVAPVGADIWAIAYYGPGGFAHIQTIQIETTGSITGKIDAATYNPPTSTRFHLIHVDGNTYASVNTGPDYDGWLKTIGIISP